jgi:DNA-binding IclR family transcriptional regulator
MGTISNALNLLGYFSEERHDIGLTEFRNLTGHDKATVYRYLSELEANGFLEQNAENKSYRLGPAILRLAAVRERSFPARQAVEPYVDRMSSELGELVHVSLLQKDVLSPLAYKDSQIRGTRVFFDQSELLPLHATSSGVATLAFGAEGLLDGILRKPLSRHTEATTTDPEALKTLVGKAQATGFAALDQAFEDDVSSIAVPIFGATEAAIGAVAVAVPSARMTEDLKTKIRSVLVNGSQDISAALGGKVPEALQQIWQNSL